MIRNQVKNFTIVQKVLKYLKLTTRYAGKTVFKLQSLLRKVLVHKYCKTKIQEEQIIAKEQIKVFE